MVCTVHCVLLLHSPWNRILHYFCIHLGLTPLVSGKLDTLDAHRTIALQDLLNITVENQCGKLNDNFR
jgi:hypothetical protein